MPLETQTKKTIFVKNQQVMIQIGVHPHEKLDKQALLINLEIQIKDTKEDDHLEKTFDYETIYFFIESLAQQSFSCELQETLARKILDFIFSFNTILYAFVEVSKTTALQNCESVGVRLERFCSNYP